MSFGIIYSKKTGRIRSMVVPDHKGEEYVLGLVKLHKGEKMVLMDMEDFNSHDILQEKLNKITKLEPKDDRFAVVDEETGIVENIVIADESCGDCPPVGKLFIKSNDAGINHKYNKETSKLELIKEEENG